MKFPLLLLLTLPLFAQTQNLYIGADQSYVNEMEDCGVVFRENGQPKDVHQIFADHGCNTVRLRLWHTPSTYDTLNSGKRYSDYNDVRKSIQRAKALGMRVLLDFHLSDFWADPQHQVCPKAWWGVVNNLPLLKDSLYNYVYSTLNRLNAEGLLPEMVQIGNETNRGIMLAPAVDAAGWSLDWNRNSQLFNRAIQAVRDVSSAAGKPIKVAIHIAGPADTGWLMDGFWSHGVTDFDVIGISYYWAWHKPTSIADAGNVVAQMLQKYPGKEVMIFETGYIWTTQSNDNANNIISEVHPAYAPASPDNQRRWLIDMTKKVLEKGATGVLYWEPSWVSSSCWTPWGQGSHQEHATFFDFQNNLIEEGGVKWMEYAYQQASAVQTPEPGADFQAMLLPGQRALQLRLSGLQGARRLTLQLLHISGKVIATEYWDSDAEGRLDATVSLPSLRPGIYYAAMYDGKEFLGVRGFGVLTE